MSRKRDTGPEPVTVTLASPQDITVDVPGLVRFLFVGPQAFKRAAEVFVDAELLADSILLAGRSTVQNESPTARTAGPSVEQRNASVSYR